MMKTIFRLFCGWMAIALTACTADELAQVADTQNTNATRTVSVKAYTPDEQPESRLAFEEKQDGSLGVSWAEGDAFTAVVGDEKVTFTYDTGKNEFTAELPEGVTLADGVTAHYPAYTDEYSTDFSAQTGKLDSEVTYMEGTYSASENSFRFSHSTAILKAAFSGLPDGAAVSSIEVKVNSYTIHIPYTSDLDLSTGIYIYLPTIDKDEEVVFDVTAAEVIYSATQTVTLNDGINVGKVYNAIIALSEVVCNLPTGSDFNNAIKSVPDFNNATSIEFEVNSNETGGTQLGNSLAYAKVDGTTLKVYTAASKFVFDASCYLMFYELSGITSIAFGDNIDMSGVTDMSSMFNGCSSLTTLTLGDNFNTSKVTTMSNMFYGCSSLTTLTLGANFNTSNVMYMSSMFDGCLALATLDLSSFDTDNVTNMQFMFNECSALTTLDLINFDTGNVTTMYQMFRYCSALTSLDLSSFDTGKVENMYGMFMGCSSLATLTFGENFDTGMVTTMYGMFMGCSSLATLTLGENFDTGMVTDMSLMFDGCSSLATLTFGENFNTGNVTNMSDMFYGCSRLESLDLSSFNTSKVKDMSDMFYGCSSLATLTFGENFNTGNVTDMSYMFYGCASLTELDLSSFDTGKVTTMYGMFYGCSSLATLTLGESFDTGNVKDMSSMFESCLGLTTLTFGENFNTGNVTDMSSMFRDCASLTSLDLSGFNTSKVDNMGSMFYGCSYLTELNLSSFSTDVLTYCVDMFKNVKSGCAITISGALSEKVDGQLSGYTVTVQ